MNSTTQDRALEILAEAQAVLTNGHFVYKSKLHGEVYVNKDRVYLHPRLVSKLCHMIAERFRDHEAYVVVAPAVGGIPLSQWTTYHLIQMTGYDVLAAYVEKSDDPDHPFKFTRGYGELIKGRRVLVVEDVLTTGASAAATVKAVTEAGGTVVGVGAICNRGGVTAEKLGVGNLFSLVELELKTYTREECPFCQPGEHHREINTTVGHGKAFLEEQAAKA